LRLIGNRQIDTAKASIRIPNSLFALVMKALVLAASRRACLPAIKRRRFGNDNLLGVLRDRVGNCGGPDSNRPLGVGLA
jgi:hypothetical protein